MTLKDILHFSDICDIVTLLHKSLPDNASLKSKSVIAKFKLNMPIHLQLMVFRWPSRPAYLFFPSWNFKVHILASYLDKILKDIWELEKVCDTQRLIPGLSTPVANTLISTPRGYCLAKLLKKSGIYWEHLL